MHCNSAPAPNMGRLNPAELIKCRCWKADLQSADLLKWLIFLRTLIMLKWLTLLQGWRTIGWSMYMAYLFIKNADLLLTDLYILLKKGMFYFMSDVFTKIADLLVTNPVSDWSDKWSAENNDLNLVMCLYSVIIKWSSYQHIIFISNHPEGPQTVSQIQKKDTKPKSSSYSTWHASNIMYISG